MKGIVPWSVNEGSEAGRGKEDRQVGRKGRHQTMHSTSHTRYGQASSPNGEWRAELKKFGLMCRGLEGVMTLSILSTSGGWNIQHDWSLFVKQLRLSCGRSGYYMIRD